MQDSIVGQDARLTCWAWNPDIGDRQRLLLVLLSFRGAAGADAAMGGGSSKAAITSVLPVAQLHIHLHISRFSQDQNPGTGAELTPWGVIRPQPGLCCLHLHHARLVLATVVDCIYNAIENEVACTSVTQAACVLSCLWQLLKIEQVVLAEVTDSKLKHRHVCYMDSQAAITLQQSHVEMIQRMIPNGQL